MVPLDCKSCIRVPINKREVAFQVTDREGNSVLRVELQYGRTSIVHDWSHVVLIANDGLLLAQCLPVRGRRNEFQLLRGNGEYFGKLVQGGQEEMTKSPSHEEASCTIRAGVGGEWFFLGDCDSDALEVRDNLDRIVAVARQDESRERHQFGNAEKAYLLEVKPQMDVSIALYGLLIINHLF